MSDISNVRLIRGRGDLIAYYEQLAVQEQVDGNFREKHEPIRVVPKSFDQSIDWDVDECTANFRRRFDRASVASAPAKEAEQIGIFHLNSGWLLCESPIEKKILPWLVFGDYQCRDNNLVAVPIIDPRANIAPIKAEVSIYPQLQIGRVRVDFAIVARCGDKSIMIDLECDGRDFHNAVDDIKRNGYLAALGFRTVRATGSEIYRNPGDVFDRVDEALRAVR